MKEVTVLSLFIPAQALEHPSNGEFFTLADKLRMAALRLHLNGNFQDLMTVQDHVPYVFLEKHTFRPKNLGYDVVVKIS